MAVKNPHPLMFTQPLEQAHRTHRRAVWLALALAVALLGGVLTEVAVRVHHLCANVPPGWCD